MREIKFRAWDNESKAWYAPIHEAYRGGLFELFISFKGDLCAHTMSGMEHQSTWPEGKYILMQFTGLKDKKGKEIYEGDIVDRFCTCNSCNSKWCGEIVYMESRGMFGFRDYTIQADSELIMYEETENGREGKIAPLEVVGNIYENPNLLSSPPKAE